MDNITANIMFFPLFEKKDEATDPWGKNFLNPFGIVSPFTYIVFFFFFIQEWKLKEWKCK